MTVFEFLKGTTNLTFFILCFFRSYNKVVKSYFQTTEADQLQADIQLHRKIVAAAERLANDRTTNKLVRKKRKRDFKAAATKLRGLEKGLYQLRLSASKPDISEFDGLSQLPKSSVGSGFSLNSLKHWPNFMNPKIGFVAKSCPTTPRGSIQDMSQEDVEKLSVGKAFNMRGPAQRTANKISALNWAEKQRRSSGALPPSVPQRKHTTGSLGYCQSDSSSLACQSTSSIAFETPTYSNIGYESVVPYQSSYRRSNFPTLQERYGLASRSRSTSSYGEPIRRTEYHGQHQSTISEKRDTDSVIATGFSTSSLDRRMLRSRPTSTTSVNPQLRDSTSSGVSSASSFAGSPCTMSRTTTFPVSPEYGEPSSHTMTSSISSSRLQPQNIDHILSSISSRAAIHFKNSPALGSPSKKTATVV
ncbi:unnamed protein product [Bursaphelenchus okinawaensis]|uniref:Uncharacterized protein n=1 Tax=Bursaphelenchus okinawaensis TaxID=465554 RepID=A0A811KU80_9BILA|nr:unnamed protein product [Bursaphelenchus okinawaensis]CAG9112275.1 unnamed protein product [Bursaphelenchus okinawaensis]